MKRVNPVDYLVIGHITQDLTPGGPVLGGTAAYAARTARAFGLRVGVLTSAREGEPLLDRLACAGVEVVSLPAPATTTFTNLYEGGHRRQILSARAATITAADVPPAWADAPIVHLGPLDAEIEIGLAARFPNSFVGVTPQGWLRRWDEGGVISACCWEEAARVLPLASAVVLSYEDLRGNLALIDQYARQARLLVVTLGARGADLYVQGKILHAPARWVREVDPTGAGDIFAAAFFAWLQRHPGDMGDLMDAAHLAAHIATTSITRVGIEGVPTPEEVAEARRILDIQE